ncbi:hypothetical protein MBLNU230_g5915t1 [Neophaeotheca triangularis]
MKLNKPRTFESVHGSRSSTFTNGRPQATDHPDLPLRTSVSDLRRPDARQNLRQHLSATFPMGADDNAQEQSVDGVNMGNFVENVKERLARSGSLGVGRNASAQSSSTTLDTVGARRPSVTQEHQPIDVAAAINILQELRKNASPEELVALHRALLPTRDVETVQSPVHDGNDMQLQGRSSVIRRRSMQPPGFATRGGASGDPLRRQGEDRPSPQQQQQQPQHQQHQQQQQKCPSVAEYTDWGQRVAPSAAAALAALDLAEKSEDMRSATPSDTGYAYTGGFTPGTLHVTNGAPSPEPGQRRDRPGDRQQAAMPEDEGSYFAGTENGPTANAGPSRKSHNESMLSPGRPPNHIVSQLQQSPRHRYRRSDSQITHSREGSYGRIPLKLDVAAAEAEKADDVAPLASQSTRPYTTQRSHQASAYSQEYMDECQLPDSPYGTANFDHHATRLSTVYDVNSEMSDDGRGTPDEALNKLTGSDDVSRTSTLKQEVAQDNDGQSARHLKRPVPEKKADSGYSSDYSRLGLQRNQRADMGPNHSSPEGGEQLEPRPERKLPNPTQAETESLYTFGEALAIPDLPVSSPGASPASNNSEKKQSRFMGLRSRKSVNRNSMPMIGASTDSLATTASAPADSPKAERKTSLGAKPGRKLQKPMPASKKDKEREKRKQSKVEETKVEEVKHDVKRDSLPAVPRALSASFTRRLSNDPSRSHLEQTYASTDHTDSQEALDREEPQPGTEAQQPSVEVQPSIETATPRQSSADDSRQRSRSFSRSESRGRPHKKEMATERASDSPDRKKTSIFNFRARSRSRARSKSQARANEGEDASRQINRMASEDDLHDHSDYAAIAASLGSNPYDISTRQFHRSSSAQRDDAEWHMQSPHAFGNGFIRAGMTEEAASEFARKKSRDAVPEPATLSQEHPQERPQTVTPKESYQTGMTEEMASQLARKKSRDVVGENTDPARERPRMATPRASQASVRSSQTAPAQAPQHAVAVGSSSVEERFPGWNGKAANPEQVKKDPGKAIRPKSYAESIPPLPELPADVGVKASKAEEAMQKKLNSSARSSPTSSKRNSGNVSPQQSNKYIKEMVAARRRQEESPARGSPARGSSSRKNSEDSQQVAEDQKLELLHPLNRTAVKREFNVAVRELSNSNSNSEESLVPGTAGVQETAPRSVPDANEVEASERPMPSVRHAGDGQQGSSSQPTGRVQQEHVEEAVSPISSPQESQQPDMAGWEAQAKLWKQRRQSLGETLSKKPMTSTTTTTTTSTKRSGPRDSPADAPSIVVSRYVTPLGDDNAARANAGPQQNGSASQYADEYRGMLDTDDKENRPAQEDMARTGSASTASSNVVYTTTAPNERPAKNDAQGSTTTQTYHSPTTVVRSRSRKTVICPPHSASPITTTSTRSQGPGVHHTTHSSGTGSTNTTTTTTTSRARSRSRPRPTTTQTTHHTSQPSDGSTTRRARTHSLARLNGENEPEIAPALPQQHYQNYSYHSPSPQPHRPQQDQTYRPSPRPLQSLQPAKSSPNSLHDRYSGGFEYGWQRGEGFGGSAGTRASGDGGARKGLKLSEAWGVDMSDVPVFVQR